MRKDVHDRLFHNQFKTEMRGKIWPVVLFLSCMIVCVGVGSLIGMRVEERNPGYDGRPSANPTPQKIGVGIGTLVGFIIWFIMWRIKRHWEIKDFHRTHYYSARSR